MAEVPSFSNSRPPTNGGRGALLGRFELRKRLGQGAQSMVYLAFDPRMEREVAIKVMRLGEGSDEAAVAQWLQEARSAGRVTHPNIVPVYEADIQERQPYLVFEYVDGQTLAALIKERGAMPGPAAVALVLDVLDALAAAHTAGVVHRDLKPSNILVDKAGRARVMDFGIAARIKDARSTEPDTPSGGTPGYLSPEAAGGAAPAASMDIFSVGMVLAEMLLGRPLIAEQDPYRAIYRVLHEQLMLPADAGRDLDERLRSIVTRALAKDPKQRFSSARAFMAELESWSKSGTDTPQAEAAGGGGGGSRGTLDFLLRRMRHKSDFPALSESIVRIQSMASSDKESVNSVTNEILKDVALTNKLLRLVNSAHYARGSSISTVSRAVSLVGFNGIRNMALSLVLLEHMADKAHAAQLKEEFLRSLMAGTIGAELCPTLRESEETFIGAMFQNLGRLLVQYYFPEEARAVRTLVQNAREPMTEHAAALSVLGMSFEDLGQGIAKAWGLPQPLVKCMSKPTGAPPQSTPLDAGERLRWVALAANDIADVLLHADPKDVDRQVEQVTAKYMRSMGLSAKDVQGATVKARKKLVELAVAMEIKVAPQSAAARLLKVPSDEADAGGAHSTQGTLESMELQATHSSLAPLDGGDGAASATGVIRVAMGDTLAAGIQDITNAMVEDFKLVDVLRMILETMFRAMELDRIIFCMRDAKTEMMTGRFGLGTGVDAHVKGFRTHLKAPTPDLFAIVCNKGADTMIRDTSDAVISQRLPAWYRSGLNAPAFLLLPLQIKGGPFGLIYADKLQHGSLELDEKELSLLRTLRNQAVMAFKQSQ